MPDDNPPDTEISDFGLPDEINVSLESLLKVWLHHKGHDIQRAHGEYFDEIMLSSVTISHPDAELRVSIDRGLAMVVETDWIVHTEHDPTIAASTDD